MIHEIPSDRQIHEPWSGPRNHRGGNKGRATTEGPAQLVPPSPPCRPPAVQMPAPAPVRLPDTESGATVNKKAWPIESMKALSHLASLPPSYPQPGSHQHQHHSGHHSGGCGTGPGDTAHTRLPRFVPRARRARQYVLFS